MRMKDISITYVFSVVPKPEDKYPKDPCLPSPCGPNALCRTIGDAPACSCMQNYIGVPPNCRPECSINSDCPANRACIREKCRDPCPGSCGILARCSVINHTPSCVCPEGYTGDPFVSCNVLPQIPRKNFNFHHVIVATLLIIINHCNLAYAYFSTSPRPMQSITVRPERSMQQWSLHMHTRILWRPVCWL